MAVYQVGPTDYMGSRESGPPRRQPRKYFVKTYYRKRYRAVDLWRVKRRMRCAQQAPEIS